MLQILRNVLITLYQHVGASLVMTILLMFTYMFIKENGVRKALFTWIQNFKTNREFRKFFALGFYCAMILFRTVFCRTLWVNPVVNILGTWSLYDADGKLYTENIENYILFLPFVLLFLWVYQKQIFKKITFNEVIVKSSLLSLGCSLGILQLFFKLGTFQLSDIFFNTFGGLSGGLIYWFVLKAHKHFK